MVDLAITYPWIDGYIIDYEADCGDCAPGPNQGVQNVTKCLLTRATCVPKEAALLAMFFKTLSTALHAKGKTLGFATNKNGAGYEHWPYYQSYLDSGVDRLYEMGTYSNHTCGERIPACDERGDRENVTLQLLEYPLGNTAFGLGDYLLFDTPAETGAWLNELKARSVGMPGQLTVHVYDLFGAVPPGTVPGGCDANNTELGPHCARPPESWWPEFEKFHANHSVRPLSLKLDDESPALPNDYPMFEPPVRVALGANNENVYALTHKVLLTNAHDKSSVCVSRDGATTWQTEPVPAGFHPPGPSASGIGLYYYHSGDGQLRDFGSITETMGLRRNFTAFLSPTFDEITLPTDASTVSRGSPGFTVTTHARSIGIRGLPHPVQCLVQDSKIVPGGCPMYLDDSGSTIIPGSGSSPSTYVQLAEVSWGGHGISMSVVAFVSVDQRSWEFASIVANASWFGANVEEGPNENALALLSDGRTLLSMFRVDGGDGPRGSHSPYFSARSTDSARSWTRPVAVAGTGSARPRLAQLGNGAGPLILSGGRALNLGTRDILMWVSGDGLGNLWQRYSISYWHNRLAVNSSDHFTKNVNSTNPKHPGGGGAETTGYTTVLWLGNRTGVITYYRSVFAHED
jgi:hypothetical protein